MECCFLERRLEERKNAQAAQDELAKAVESRSIQDLQASLAGARKMGVELHRIRAAEHLLEQLGQQEEHDQRMEEERSSMQERIRNAMGSERKLRTCLRDSIDAGFEAEANFAQELIQEIVEGRERTQKQELQLCITDAKNDATQLRELCSTAELAGFTEEAELARTYLNQALQN